MPYLFEKKNCFSQPKNFLTLFLLLTKKQKGLITSF